MSYRMNTVEDAIRLYQSLSQPRMLTTGLDQAEIATLEGDRFNAEKVFSNFDIAVPVYFLFENPIDSGVIVGLQERKLKTDTGGITNFQILWDYDVSNATPTQMPVFNQNNLFRVAKPGKVEISVLNPLTASPDNGNWVLSGTTYTPTDEGIEREPDFIQTSGVGVNTSGDISPDLGFRIYGPGTGFLTKAVSAVDNNRILWGYDWIEAPLSLSE